MIKMCCLYDFCLYDLYVLYVFFVPCFIVFVFLLMLSAHVIYLHDFTCCFIFLHVDDLLKTSKNLCFFPFVRLLGIKLGMLEF